MLKADRSIGNEYRENENIMHQTDRTEDRVTISRHKNRAWLSVFSGQLVTTEYLCKEVTKQKPPMGRGVLETQVTPQDVVPKLET